MGIERLLEENQTAYYWMGFLSADGCFSDNKKSIYRGAISLSLCEKDKNHIYKFSEFIDSNVLKTIAKLNNKNFVQYTTNKSGVNFYRLIKDKFGIEKHKTYNPIIKDITRDDFFISFLIGYIDGDGSISKDKRYDGYELAITVHSSWANVLNKWFKRCWELAQISPVFKIPKVIITKRYGHARIRTTNWRLHWFLKKHINKFNLPVLKRKWDKVHKHRGQIERVINKKEKILNCFYLGMSTKQISNFLKINRDYIYDVIQNREQVRKMIKTAEGPLLKKDASNYDKEAFEHPSVTVDICICSIIDKELKVLLIKRKFPPFQDSYAIPGGFVSLPAKETLEETAARELHEETNLKGIFIEQLKTYGDPDRDPRMRVITVAYYALVPYNQVEDIKAGDDAADAQWFPIRKLLIDGVTCELAFDHKTIIEDVLNRLVGKVSYTPVAFNLIPKDFTWTELQMVFEAILGKKFIVPDFRSSILSKYDIKVLDKKRKMNGKGRPSNLLNLIGEKKKIF